MADTEKFARIYLSNGKTVDVEGTVAEVHSKVNSAGGGLLQIDDHQGRPAVINPQHITHIRAEGAGQGAAAW